MSNIAIFNFEQSQVRTAINANNEPYFCLADVAEILEIQNVSQIVAKQLDKNGCTKIEITDSLNRKQIATFINEPNLYRVIFRSNKAEAVKFQNWVFDEVLPSIRKTGSYIAPIAETKLTDPQQRELANKVRSVCQHDRKRYSIVWNGLKDHFKVERYTEIPSVKYAEALGLVDIIAKANFDDEIIPPTQNQSYLTEQDTLTLAKIMYYAKGYVDFIEKIKSNANEVMAQYNYKTNDDDDGYFVMFRPKYKQDISKAIDLFDSIAKKSIKLN